jgi:hypothetical protein
MRVPLLILLLFQSFWAIGQKKLIFSDHSYEEEIRTVMLHPRFQGNRDNLRPAVVPLQKQNLLLQFDDLRGQRDSYYVKLIHCNYDWTKSRLMDLDFLTDYNEFPINEFEFSFNTSIPYVHYFFEVPSVKLPGNYLLVAYRNSDDDLILTKRFMVYDNQVSLMAEDQSQGIGNLRANNQQLNFKINYGRTPIVDPYQSVKAMVRQNQRWDNVRTNITPSFLREDIHELEYRFFDQSNEYKAGNEFRFVDLRSLNSPGRNTGRLDRSKRPFHLTVQTDKSRGDDVYSQYPDLNGGYVIENLDNRDAYISGDYVFVTFTLQSQPVSGNVYVMGALTNWERSADTKMEYVASRKAYEKTLFLKQGWYDYQYWVDSPQHDAYHVEGSFFETENLYEVFIYYRPFRPDADLLIGYFPIPVNPR